MTYKREYPLPKKIGLDLFSEQMILQCYRI